MGALQSEGGADFAFDSIGTTLPSSIAALKNGGRVVVFGMANGQPEPIDPSSLTMNSIGVIWADLWTYLSSGQERRARAGRLFTDLIAGNITQPEITTFPLHSGVDAHRLMEDRKFAGKIILVPGVD